MSIANIIMKEPPMSSEVSRAHVARKRAEESAVKTELSDAKDIYFFDDGSLLIIEANGALRSGLYGQPKAQAMDAVGELQPSEIVPPPKPLTDLEQFRALHAKLSTAAKLPKPCLLLTEDAYVIVYGVDGFKLGQWAADNLESLKAATGYPVYVKREIQFDSINVVNYERI